MDTRVKKVVYSNGGVRYYPEWKYSLDDYKKDIKDNKILYLSIIFTYIVSIYGLFLNKYGKLVSNDSF